MRILADASLPNLSQAFPSPFELTLYKDNEQVPSLLKGHDILLCRTTLKVNESLLQTNPLKYVATASSGRDHIDLHYLEKKAIPLIDAKGANARAVADYVIASLAFLQKYKNFRGIKACVIGVGEVGSRVLKRLQAAGMTVFCYDPPKALLDKKFVSQALEIIKDCDLLSIHASLHESEPYPSKNLIDKNLLGQLKPGVVIINAARGGIVDEESLLKRKEALIYCTDVYNHEPSISKELIEFATLCTPHIAGHSVEAKFTAIRLISEKLHALMNLRAPRWQPPIKITANKNLSSLGWQDIILSLYNPLYETMQLKGSEDCKTTFIQLRKAHQNRHDFCNYKIKTNDKQIQKILGRETLVY